MAENHTAGEGGRPTFNVVDHVSWTVPDLDAALAFYRDVLGATELYRMGPLDAADLPVGDDGRDWMASHVGVSGARLTLVMLKLSDNLNFQLVQYDKPSDRRQDVPRNCDRGGHHLAFKVDDVEAAAAWLAQHGCTPLEVIEIAEGPLAGKKNLYIQDPFGHQLELVD
ncbi:VOC family protein [Brevundimonas sp.]|uniref:VOC family protein n=1 Tax=Brevundimonas sp. TaxID=1871086 RepID=UPI0025BAF799|nr:VOC family protein [Brevundimonas sp.]